MHPRVVLAAVLASVTLTATVVTTTTLQQLRGDTGSALAARMRPLPPAPAVADPVPPVSDPVPPEPRLDPPATVEVDVEGFLAWAALDLTTDELAHSANANDTSSVESVIKVWIVADHLRRVAEAGGEPSDQDLADARAAIRYSNNATAQRLYAAGGHDEVVDRMVDICRLTDTYLPEADVGWWSRVEISAVDTVRLGRCVVDERAAGPEWTDWVLAEMREVSGTTADQDQRADQGFEGGRWGIVDAFPPEDQSQISFKNGWTRLGRTNSWHVNCLGITDAWVLAVLMRYPAEYSLDYGAERCAEVAGQLFLGPAMVGDRAVE